MCRWTVLIILFLFLTTAGVFAETFTVTNNADSGPGTLREALTKAAANGSAEKDYIYFNLPGSTGQVRTIILQSLLPDVTGNVIIDASTQPGAAFGVSNAKVIITPVAPARDFNAFNVSESVQPTDAVEFYGLYIKGFSPDISAYGGGIKTINNCMLVVGAPGKGNVIAGNSYSITGELENAKIQSNFMGLEPDGETVFVNQGGLYAAHYFNNMLIGGDDPADGNIIIGGNDGCLRFGVGNGPNGDRNVIIKNNFFGTDYTGKKALQVYEPFGFIYAYAPAIALQVDANVFTAGIDAIIVFGVGKSSVVAHGNFFGTDKTQSVALGSGGELLDVNGFVSTIFGGDADADQNVVTGYFNPISGDANYPTTIIKNKFYCNNLVELMPQPGNYVRIIKLFDNSVSGDAPPGAMVQLYYSTEQCSTCNPNTWFATVTADVNGVWTYKGDTRKNVMASSTVGGRTIGFEPYYIGPDQVNVLNYDCHHKGSIELKEKREGRFQFKWTDDKGKLLGTGQKIDNLEPGTYSLEINEGGACPIATGKFDVIDTHPYVYPQTFQLDCANPTGSFDAYVQPMSDYTAVKYYWENDKGKIISNDESIKNLPAGKYYLYFTDSNGCTSEKELYEVLPPPDAPTLDDSKANVTDANCDFTNGAITGLVLTNAGNALYGWARADGTIINYGQLDLTAAAPGDYYFFVDNSNCPELKSKTFTVKSKNGITADFSDVQTTPAGCAANTGAITGVKITGATKYKWTDINNAIAGTNPDLQNAPAGIYTLTASNEFGCSVTSSSFTISQVQPAQFPQYPVSIVTACYHGQNGSITITADALVKSFRWVDGQGVDAGTQSTLAGAKAGNYQLYLTDKNGCEQLYNTYTVGEEPEYTVANYGDVTHDQCGLTTGSISNVVISGGVPPYTYKWTDAAGNTIGANNSITGLAAGDYKLNVLDTRCGNVVISYTINATSADIAPPAVSDVQLCSSGSAVISVNNPSPTTTYRLYESSTSANPIYERTGGHFNVTVSGNRSYFISQLSGTCESNRAEIKVAVGLSVKDIANTFTPNADGINDYWKISNIESYPDALVQVFTRYGQKVFEFKGYSKPFDGTLNGKQLPAGVYYYIISLNSNCNVLSGSLTVIR